MVFRAFRFFAVVLLYSFAAKAQTGNYNFSTIDIESGLSHNQVYSIYRDSIGFAWFGTGSGLNRFDGYTCKVYNSIPNDSTSMPDNNVSEIFGLPGNRMWIASTDTASVFDPVTEKFDRHFQTYLRLLHLPESRLSCSIKDRQGNYWFLFDNEGLYKYSTVRHQTTHFDAHDKQAAGQMINQIAADEHDNIWVLYGNGYLLKLDALTLQPKASSALLSPFLRSDKLKLKLFADRNQNVWIYSAEDPFGVFKIDLLTNSIKHITKTSDPLRLNDNMIAGLLQDEKGLIWIGTDHGGINLINETADKSLGILVNHENNKSSLGYNSVQRLYGDDRGGIWVGTGKKGVSYLNQHIVQFDVYRHERDKPGNLPYNDINCFQEDPKGNVWIGTNGGGLVYFDRAKTNTNNT